MDDPDDLVIGDEVTVNYGNFCVNGTLREKKPFEGYKIELDEENKLKITQEIQNTLDISETANRWYIFPMRPGLTVYSRERLSASEASMCGFGRDIFNGGKKTTKRLTKSKKTRTRKHKKKSKKNKTKGRKKLISR